MKNGSSALRFDEFFEAESQRRTRGHSWKIVKQRNYLDLRKYFFSARVVDRWNRLDQKDIDIDAVNGFKRDWKSYATQGWASSWTSSAKPQGLTGLDYSTPGVATPGK